MVNENLYNKSFDKYLKVLESNFSPKDFECKTIEEVAKLFCEYIDEDVDLFLLFDVIHEKYEYNNCDECGGLFPTMELLWNSMGSCCTYCYEAMSENEKRAFNRLVLL